MKSLLASLCLIYAFIPSMVYALGNYTYPLYFEFEITMGGKKTGVAKTWVLDKDTSRTHQYVDKDAMLDHAVMTIRKTVKNSENVNTKDTSAKPSETILSSVTINKGKLSYEINPLEKKIEILESENGQKVHLPEKYGPDDYQSLKTYRFQYLRAEEFDGQLCDVYGTATLEALDKVKAKDLPPSTLNELKKESARPYIDGDTKYFITKSDGFLIKVESNSSMGSGETVWRNLKVQPKNFPANITKLPKGYKVYRLKHTIEKRQDMARSGNLASIDDMDYLGVTDENGEIKK